MSLITEADFVDLYFGDDFADVKGLKGAGTSRVSVPEAWAAEIEELRQRCQAVYQERQDPEFALSLEGTILRVTQFNDAFSGSVYVLRKSNAQIRNFNMLGFPREVAQALLDPGLRGLVLICGDMGTGKTSKAASLIVERLTRHGGIAFAVEDPPETNLNGQHGLGRCIQVQTSRRSGGYSEALTRTLRTGTDLVLIGEIRDEDTAYQACKASLNGHLVIATMHSKSGPQAIEKLVTLAKPLAGNAYEVAAEGLQAVICQSLDTNGITRHLVAEPLLLTGADAPSIRNKIRRQEIHLVEDDTTRQKQASLWG